MLRHLMIVLLLVFSVTISAQTVSGSWYGRADVMMHGSYNNYLTELIVKQKGNDVEGIFGYYFKDSYQSFFIRGTYNPKTREVLIRNLPVLFYLSRGPDGIECPMHFHGILMASQVSSTIRGTFTTEEKYKYTCPELRVTLAMDYNEKDPDSILKNATVGKKFWSPGQEDFVIANASGTTTKKDSGDLILKDTSQATAEKNEETAKLLKAAFEKRKNTYSRELLVESDSVRISFYDNGDIDGDSISVFLNNQPVLIKHELTSRALNIYLALDSTKSVNELSMFAENLGKYPPNTALMLVSDGINRYEMYLSSSLTQNATVKLRRKKLKIKN